MSALNCSVKFSADCPPRTARPDALLLNTNQWWYADFLCIYWIQTEARQFKHQNTKQLEFRGQGWIPCCHHVRPISVRNKKNPLKVTIGYRVLPFSHLYCIINCNHQEMSPLKATEHFRKALVCVFLWSGVLPIIYCSLSLLVHQKCILVRGSLNLTIVYLPFNKNRFLHVEKPKSLPPDT